MAQITSINKIINGTLGQSTPINENFANIKAVYNAHDIATTGIHDVGSEEIAGSEYLQGFIDLFSPISSVLDVWRPSSLTFDKSIDTDIFLVMDGSTVDDGDSLFDTVILPDMTNRYFIGMGTEEGGDMLSDTTNMSTPIGTAGHLISVSHLNTFPDHTHLHQHTESTHTHNGLTTASSGIRCGELAIFTAFTGLFSQTTPSATSHNYNFSTTIDYDYSYPSGSSVSNVIPMTVFSTDSFSVYSNYVATPNTLSANDSSVYTGTGTDFDIQPSSLAVRRYIRYK
jgi:hypothetical protein